MKVKLREEMRSLLLAIRNNELERDQRSLKISKSLLNFLQTQKVIHEDIGIFYPLADEVSLISLDIENLSFPKMVDDKGVMEFRTSTLSDLIKTEAFGKTFFEPSDKSKVVIPKVIIIPGLAFDRKGNRLGRGKGFYDRYLSSFSGVKIGVCFHEQIVDEVPTDEFDQSMDIIITDKEIVKDSK